jgi:hypothetical protein
MMSSTPEQSGTGGMAIAAFVFGLVSIPLAFFPFGMFPGPIAIILGLVAHNRPGLNAGRRRFARAGAILGAGGTLIWLTIYGLLALFAS